MADTTPVFSFPFPEAADPADVPADLEALALSLETLLNGGITAAMLAANSVGSSEIATDAVGSAEIAPGAVGSSEIADGSVADGDLASPNNGVYRTILSTHGVLSQELAAAKYLMGTTTNPLVPGSMAASGSGFDTGITPLHLIYFDDADYSVAGLTTKLRVRAQMAANATSLVSSGILTKIGLYPVTVAGGADFLAYTAGTLVTGSEVNVGVAASTIAQGVTSDFTIPSDGIYCLCLVTSVALPNNSVVSAHAQLQVRSV